MGTPILASPLFRVVFGLLLAVRGPTAIYAFAVRLFDQIGPHPLLTAIFLGLMLIAYVAGVCLVALNIWARLFAVIVVALPYLLWLGLLQMAVESCRAGHMESCF